MVSILGWNTVSEPNTAGYNSAFIKMKKRTPMTARVPKGLQRRKIPHILSF